MIARLMGLATASPREVQRGLEEGSIVVLDVNAPASWRYAHVPGARRLDPAAFEPADLPRQRDAALVFYCSNPFCRKAPTAAKRAIAMGWANVRVMSAGLSGWISAGLPIETG